MESFRLICLVLLVTQMFGQIETKNKDPEHTNIILIGATGDLAKKYLWNGIFELFMDKYKSGVRHFNVYACSRKSPEKGRELLSEILLSVIDCEVYDDVESCREKKKAFVQATQFSQLKTEKDYQAVGKKIQDNTVSQYGLTQGHVSYEHGRMVYLSIPPNSYSKVIELVNKYLRPTIGRPWFRLVLEKPLGRDVKSATKLSQQVSKMYKEEEVYLIDHYRGKPVMKSIFTFRFLNRNIDFSIWNRHYIDRIEVVMKETLGVEGRYEMYHDLGVVRDVMQNHLTEMLIDAAMDMPKESNKINFIMKSRAKFLKELQFSSYSFLHGQYATYLEEAPEDLRGTMQNNMPTFAVARFEINSNRWLGVPFILMAGKKMDVKDSYIRVVFKQNEICMNAALNDSCRLPPQIVFQISDEDDEKPDLIYVSKSLPMPRQHISWTFEDFHSNATMFGEKLDDMHKLKPIYQDEAYSALIADVFGSERHFFVRMKEAVSSWKVWTPIIEEMDKLQPRYYTGQDIQQLDFTIRGSRLDYRVDDALNFVTFRDHEASFPYIPKSLQGRPMLHASTSRIIGKLAGNILQIATDCIKDKGTFHLAFPGGQTPQKLFRLFRTQMTEFPWDKTQVWLTDERCTGFHTEGSNYGQLHEQLLSHIGILPWNVHPMPVWEAGEVCMDQPDKIYSRALQQYADLTLDYVVLGMGKDGHVASLFPNQTSHLDDSAFVSLTNSGKDEDKFADRVSLTFNTLNQAKHVSVLVLGLEKHDTLVRLSDASTDSIEYPVLGINNFTWYLDNEALLGKFDD